MLSLLYSGMWRCVLWYMGVDVSEESSASIFRIDNYITLAVLREANIIITTFRSVVLCTSVDSHRRFGGMFPTSSG